MADEDGWLRRLRREKREWREHVRRAKALPDGHREVYFLIEGYLFTFAGNSQIIPVLRGILELFEEGAAAGRGVLEVTGEDVAGFAWSTLTEVLAATWMGKKNAQLNAQVHEVLAREGSAR